ncbi:Vmc-like lipoprotein signal peptide domain-containing protein [Mycoplasma sp. MV126]
MKFKKLLLSIGLSSIVVVLPISAVACNNSDVSS